MNKGMMAAAAFWLALLVGCGGGGGTENDGRATESFSAMTPLLASAKVDRANCNDEGLASRKFKLLGEQCLRSSQALRALRVASKAARESAAAPRAASTAPFTGNDLMDWAEVRFSAYFPASQRQASTLGGAVSFRYYRSTQNFLAISTETGVEAAYAYGPLTGWKVVYLGLVEDFACTVRGTECQSPTATPKLLFYETGVALSVTPSWSRLTRTVEIYATPGAKVQWTAASDKSWLSVTSSGLTNPSGRGSITLQADAAGLQSDTVNIATVTLSPAESGIESPEKLVVGVWKGSTTPTGNVRLPRTYAVLVADPVRPLVYAHNRGSSIDVYNLYQQALVATVSDVGGVLGGMTVAGDGSKLYALDTANRSVVVIDLSTRVAQPALPLVVGVAASMPIAYARPNGVPILLIGDDSIYELSPWYQLVPKSAYGNWRSITAMADGSKVVYTSQGGATAYALGATDDTFSMTRLGYVSLPNGQEAAFSRDGTKFYTASGSPYDCQVWDGTNASLYGALPAKPYPQNVKVGSDGRVYCGTSSASSTKPDVWVYSALGSLLKTLDFVSGDMADLAGRQFVVGGDGLMSAALLDGWYYGNSAIVFVPIGP